VCVAVATNMGVTSVLCKAGMGNVGVMPVVLDSIESAECANVVVAVPVVGYKDPVICVVARIICTCRFGSQCQTSNRENDNSDQRPKPRRLTSRSPCLSIMLDSASFGTAPTQRNGIHGIHVDTK
jgi:hypothetical protein